MGIKINSGWCRGLTLKSPPALHTRPTASRTREAVWNSLQFELQGIEIIDLFCGSGAVGLEAVSRGARTCLFVDNSSGAFRCLNDNIKQVKQRALSSDRQIELRSEKAEAVQVLKRLKEDSKDLVWMDPPYDIVPQELALLAPLAHKCLRQDGKFIVECDERGVAAVTVLLDSPEWLEVKHKRYGKTYITILQKRANI